LYAKSDSFGSTALAEAARERNDADLLSVRGDVESGELCWVELCGRA
jgi:hypothetical protein